MEYLTEYSLTTISPIDNKVNFNFIVHLHVMLSFPFKRRSSNLENEHHEEKNFIMSRSCSGMCRIPESSSYGDCVLQILLGA